jgi:hypothetical protein
MVERGVIVGGLMICGSFLLAALLNRSAMEEVPTPAATPSAVVSPVVAPAPLPKVSDDCSNEEAPADTSAASAPGQSAGSDLMVNGNERCQR